MNERLRKIRAAIGISQQEFSKRINVGYSTLAMLETGQRKIKDIHIAAICHVFNVNEVWFRTGVGEMFNAEDYTTDKDIIDVIHTLGLKGIAASFVNIYLHLPDSEQDTIKRFIQQLLDSHDAIAEPQTVKSDEERFKELSGKSKVDMTEEEFHEYKVLLEAETEQQNLLEKRQEDDARVS